MRAYTMRQSATAGEALTRTPLELLLQRSPKVQTPSVDGGGEESKDKNWEESKGDGKKRSKERGEGEGF